MTPKNTSTLAAALLLGCLTTSAVAGTATHDGRDRNAARAHRHTAFQMRHDAGHAVAHRPGYAARVGAPSEFGSGYVFVPGRGILGEDCDMPTSTCPNELRDTQ